MPLIATFLSSYLRFVHATDCYIFVIIKTCGGGNRKPGLNLGFDMYVEKTRVNYVIQASELHGCMFPGFSLLHPDND